MKEENYASEKDWYFCVCSGVRGAGIECRSESGRRTFGNMENECGEVHVQSWTGTEKHRAEDRDRRKKLQGPFRKCGCSGQGDHAGVQRNARREGLSREGIAVGSG